jgi:CRISPR-associated protein (TIGR03986 family)
VAEGKLVVNAKKQVRIRFTNSKGKEVEMAVPDAELSAALKREPVEKLNGRPVELDEANGQPRRVRPVGEAFAAAPPGGQRSPPEDRGQQRRQPGRRTGPQPQRERRQPQHPPAFHNPYNFVPAPLRDGITGELADAAPAGHERYHADRYSGVIKVKLIVDTPLLLPDAAGASVDANRHKSFPVRLGADGRPYIPPTSIKGMLRSAYEAVTNSRLAVFTGHDHELAYRMATNEALRLIPARVEGDQLMLLPGTSGIERGQDEPMYAAWLPRYHHGRLDALAYPDGSLPQHRDAVTCWLVQVRHRSGRFSFWGVRAIFPRGQVAGSPDADCLQADGYVCITGANINRKHAERVFFVHGRGPLRIPLTPELHRRWRELICNYQTTHARELAERARRGESPDQYLGPEPGRTAWSRHVYKPGEAQLSDGSLCYAALDQHGSVVQLYPVMISRKLHDQSPHDRLPLSLQPAARRELLSPADRVFGWVNQDGHGAYRGNLRVGPVRCDTADAVAAFGEPGLPLAIFGQPKPQQARFYVAVSPQGEPQPRGLSKEEAGYREGKGLRGRKVYPHHAGLPEGYWDRPMEDRTRTASGGRYQEYRRPDGADQRDDQNRSVHGWVRPGALFRFDLHVTNLSRVELGALLWLLSLEEGHFHRLGGGKPLGFGSVRLTIDSMDVRTGAAWTEFYGTLEEIASPALDAQAIIRAFTDEVAGAYGHGQSLDQVPFIAAFLRATQGFDDGRPVHYPRARHDGDPDPVPPHVEGLAYEWFVANEQTAQGQVVEGHSLPNLASDSGLPMLKAPHQGG